MVGWCWVYGGVLLLALSVQKIMVPFVHEKSFRGPYPWQPGIIMMNECSSGRCMVHKVIHLDKGRRALIPERVLLNR